MERLHSVSATILSILQQGLVPAANLQKEEVLTSYDSELVKAVSLNCILTVDGVAQSLYQKAANSSFGVATEELITRTDSFFRAAMQRLAQEIQAYEKDNASLFNLIGNSVKKAAILKNILSIDKEFLKDLSEKAHCTAFFVLSLTPMQDETHTNAAFKETRRSSVPKDKIVKVFIPKRFEHLRSELKDVIDRITFVDSVERTIAISYKDMDNSVVSCETAKKVSVPNYEKELIELKEPGKPLYTHITRLRI